MAQQWFYSRGLKREGPISSGQLKELALSGQLLPADEVWTEGMESWIPASRIAGLWPDVDLKTASASRTPPPVVTSPLKAAAVKGQRGTARATGGYTPPAVPPPTARATQAPAPTPATAEDQPVATPLPVDYYTARAGRSKNILKGFPSITGSLAVSPMDEAQMDQLALAAQARKPIRQAAGLYRLLFFACLISAIALVVMAIILATVSGIPRPAAVDQQLAMVISAIVFGGFAGLCYIVYRATLRCRRWAPMTILTVCILAIMPDLAGIILSIMHFRRAELILGGFAAAIIPGAVGWISYSALGAIPGFLNQPAWTVEAIVQVELS